MDSACSVNDILPLIWKTLMMQLPVAYLELEFGKLKFGRLLASGKNMMPRVKR